MTVVKLFAKNGILGNIQSVIRLQKRYAQFPKHFVKSTFNKDEQKLLEEEGKTDELKHCAILPAPVGATSSEFYDALVVKFTKYIMRHGKMELARNLMQKTLENIKRIQIEKYNNAPENEKDDLELSPRVILVKAVENVCPVMNITRRKRGGISYKVPVPITPEKSKFIGIKWLINAGKEKERVVNFSTKLAHELIDASQNQGRVVMIKKDLYKQCQANRAFAHYRWM